MTDGTTRAMFDLPALFSAGDRLAIAAQRFYLWLVRGEYGLLLAAALLAWALSLFAPESDSTGAGWAIRLVYMAYALVFIASLGVMLVRSLKKPEQDWYRARALAESVKTSAWRYCMRAEPFGDIGRLAIRRGEFRDHLLAILAANRPISERMPPDVGAEDQIARSMEDVRALALADRKHFYLEHRVLDQRIWYLTKARANLAASRRWFVAGIVTYALILIIVLGGMAQAREHGATGVLVVIASSMLGWVQIRKYNELVSSYTLTSHEIGIVQSKLTEVADEAAFSTFVNEAELAFSREHTQWVARGVF